MRQPAPARHYLEAGLPNLAPAGPRMNEIAHQETMMNQPLKGFPFDQCDKFIERLDREPDAIRVFALGDSWLTVPGGWWPGRSIVQLLDDSAWVKRVDPASPRFNVISISKVGMLVADMPHDRHLVAIDYIGNEMAKRREPFRFDAVMVSAGGNDIIPRTQSLVQGGNGAASINEGAWHKMLLNLGESWQKLLDVLAPLKAPILTNGYGPIYPTRKPGTTWLPFLGIGPWAGPYLLGTLQLSPADARAIVSSILDRYNEFLANLPGIRYFDFRPVVAGLAPPKWHDEIHLFEDGWDVVARAWLAALRAVIPAPVSTLVPARGGRGAPPAIVRGRERARPAKAPPSTKAKTARRKPAAPKTRGASRRKR